jgi:Flp pilus assembly protein TadB
MATKKQRRRREKERRHEYEYVYIDEEGNEIEVEQPKSPRKERDRKAVASRNGRPARGAVRPVQPPNWRFLRKQGLVFFVILLAAFVILYHGMPIWASALVAAAYTLIMLPMMWMTQRMLYRSYLKRTGQLPPPRGRRSK